VLAALLAQHASADEIYRWIDDQGVVNYTQQKPRDKDAEAILTRSGTRATTAEPAPTVVEAPVTSATGEPLNEEQQKMLEDLRRAEAARQEEVARIKEHNCERSRDVLERLTVKNRVRVADENGQYRVMPEDERQERISEAQENIARYCASA
jgi:hypothetical protein